ncbi:MAG: DUF2520 domain-containing protein [Muribaculaceae bacterium]|nr:DUF2520 domain-containing protein [Muribaculaceae bacterium]
MSSNPTAVIIGAGNVASHLAPALNRAGYSISCVYSRTPQKAERLAELLKCAHTTDIGSVPVDADLYLIALSDSAIAPVASLMPRVSGLVVHTCGSIDISALGDVSLSTGVLYPLQSFSADDAVDVSAVPFFVEGNSPESLKQVRSIAQNLTSKVYEADGEKRKYLHLAGVLSNNFVNYLLALTEKVLKGQGYTLDTVKPLVELTVRKAFGMGPVAAQTGPARRSDRSTVAKHADLLTEEQAQLYTLISDMIIKEYEQD